VFFPILRTAAIAGLLAALLLTLLQALWVTPLILDAETYEHRANAFGMSAQVETEAQATDNFWERTTGTALANAAMGLGYGLILSSLYLLRRPSRSLLLQGVAWGLSGYAVFFAAPSLGLLPELPGTATAELSARQHWWLGTALATAAGLALLFLQARRLLQMLGLVLLILPHWLGAPQPALAVSLAPETLQLQFRVATMICNALFWLVLGISSVYLFQRCMEDNG